VEFRIWSLGSRVEDSGFMIQGLEFRVRFLGLGYGTYGVWFKAGGMGI
jgi:hypothetical protein